MGTLLQVESSLASALSFSILHWPDNLNGSAVQGKQAIACFISFGPIMSRSRRKTPVCGITTAVSEHSDKQAWHRRFRKAVRQRLAKNHNEEPPHLREFFDPWCMRKDGKRYYGVHRLAESFLRK